MLMAEKSDVHQGFISMCVTALLRRQFKTCRLLMPGKVQTPTTVREADNEEQHVGEEKSLGLEPS